MRKQPFFRPEYLPHDQSDLNSVYNYLRARINTMIRSSLEYPAILPEITPNYLKLFIDALQQKIIQKMIGKNSNPIFPN